MRSDAPHPRRRRRTTWLALCVLVGALALGAGVMADRLAPGEMPWRNADSTHQDGVGATAGGVDLPQWTMSPAPQALVSPIGIDRRAVRRTLAPLLADPDLGAHVVAAVGDLAGVEGDWTTEESTYLPASTTKLLTAAAALEQLGPQARFTTKVLSGTRAREVVLVGGGDPFLASAPPESAAQALADYPQRANLLDLARATAARLEGGKVAVRYDDSLFAGPTSSPRWRADYLPDNVVSPITALMVDGGRLADGFERAADPSGHAAQVFARALRKAGVKVVGNPAPGRAPAQAVELASASSAPLSDIVERVLEVSDNEAAEVLGHHVGLATGQEGSFAAGAAGVKQTLAQWGIDVSRLRLYDGSGLSRANRISTTSILAVLRRIASPQGTELRSVASGVPVSGFTGSLALRFENAPPGAMGTVRAKTGTLTGVHALAGWTAGRDGVVKVFVIAADRVPSPAQLQAQEAIDAAAAALAVCRCAATD